MCVCVCVCAVNNSFMRTLTDYVLHVHVCFNDQLDKTTPIQTIRVDLLLELLKLVSFHGKLTEVLQNVLSLVAGTQQGIASLLANSTASESYSRPICRACRYSVTLFFVA